MALNGIYNTSLALLTDLYQLTMAYGYWKLGRSDRRAVFHLSFRSNPFDGGYTIAAGLEYIVEYLQSARFDASDLAYLQTLEGNDGQPLFEEAFLDHLAAMRFTCDIDAVPEGTVVFPHEPLVRVIGPIMQCQILETPILNMINFSTLIATKASRVCAAARGDSVLEFGLRRAQGVDGGLTASRAAYIGGCHATSNLLAGKLFGIPVKGTHAHSWVMSFDSEREAFDAYAHAMPNNVIFLVDTYDTLAGVHNAMQSAQQLSEKGYDMGGIRLDSGDLAYLSIEARKLLDEAGFENAAIVASNNLDEHVIQSMKNQGARIDVWGVGTKLATAYDQPALGGVYKLSALQDADGRWKHVLKLSEQTAKISLPGMLQIRRFKDASGFVGDMIWDETNGPAENRLVIDPGDANRRKRIARSAVPEDVLIPIMREGEVVCAFPTLDDIRNRSAAQLQQLHPGIRRSLNPHSYPAGLDETLHNLRSELIAAERAKFE